MKRLLAAGADVNKATTNTGATPLYMASEQEHVSIVERLLAAGADVNKATTTNTTPLYIASELGNVSIVERLLAAGADVNKATTNTGATPLYVASEQEYLSIVERLLAAGADVNKATKNGETPLYIASQRRYVDIAERLITAGADVNKATTNTGTTPLYLASNNGYLRIVELLIAAGAYVNNTNRDSPLFAASINGHADVVERLIAAGANVNYQNVTGTTSLYWASQKGYTQVVEHLLAAGADVNNDASGMTPLFTASRGGYIDIVERLIAAGADVNKAKTNDGSTPLYVASLNGHLSVVKRLLIAGADKNITNKNGQLPIDVAKTPETRKLLESHDRIQGPPLKWQGWTRGDASMLDGIFGDDATARNFALCPVCMKYVERAEACMYMSHNCSTAKGYYHEELYKKYKNRDGIVNWCTICGRICKGHNHYNLAPVQGPVPAIIMGKDPFATSCEGEGGGGTTEKLLRFRRLREYAKELQARVGNIGWWEAMDALCEAMWDAPMFHTNALHTMLAEKKFNIPNTNFPLTLPPTENAPNVPNTAEPPIVHPSETEAFTNALYIDDANIIQFRHKKANGAWNRHEGQGQQISREAFIAFLKSMLENPTAEEFGKCWQYKTRSQQAALNATQKALVCDAPLHPEEVKAALDLTDAEQARLAEGYRKAFNAAMDTRKMYRP